MLNHSPQETNTERLIFYRFLRESWNAQLESYHLLYLYELPLLTPVTTLVQRVVSDMKASPFQYSFKLPWTHQAYSSHEALDLLLLEFKNRGLPRNDNQIQLRPTPHRQNQTLEDLHNDRTRFGISSVAIEGTYFVVNMGQSSNLFAKNGTISDLFPRATVVQYYPVTIMASLSADDPTPRAHTCISCKMKTTFKLDSPTGVDEDDGIEPANFSSDDENGEHRPLRLNPSSSRSTSISSTAPQQPALSAATPTSIDTAVTTVIAVGAGTASTPTPTSSALQRSSSLSTVTFIPNAVWTDIWAPQPGPYTGFFSLASIVDDVYAN